MFRKMIVAMALACAGAVAVAGQANIDVSGLSDSQVAELKAHAAKAVADAAKQADGTALQSISSNPGAAVTLAATWGQQAASAAEGFAKAFTIAARELGVTVNEFLKTDAGKLTAILIIWKVAGASLLSLLYGMVFVIVGLTITNIIYRRLFTKGYEKVAYSRFFGMFKGEKMVRVPKSFSEFRNDGEWLMIWVMIVLGMATMGFGAAIIT